jgi:hypothetical protein
MKMVAIVASIAALLAWTCAISAGLMMWQQGQRITSLENRVQELNCVHQMYEDGSAMHLDAEIAFQCLHRELGWGTPGWQYP